MVGLLAAIYDLVENTPPERITLLSGHIRELSEPGASTQIKSWAMNANANERIEILISEWKATEISPVELAGMLIGASHAYQTSAANIDIELVWTGPSSEVVATRSTEQALIEVINASTSRLFITSFVVYDLESILVALRQAQARGVAVTMLLESNEQHGGGVKIDGIDSMKKALPSAKIYYWKEKNQKFVGGKVHAKVAVCDDNTCFISSANLTGHAMQRNMEAGVLIRGGSIPRQLHRHLEALAMINVIES